MNNKIEAVFWSTIEDDDGLYESDIDQVIQDHLDQYELSEGETELTVYGFAPSDMYIKDGFSLNRLVEALDEDFGDPDKDFVITKPMREAEKLFHESVIKELQSWSCDIVEKRIINIEQWCKDNNYEIQN
jgi:hypothetical protein